MHVARSPRATWQGPGLENRFARFDTKGRAIRMYRRLLGAGFLAALRTFGARWTARMEKARSETQSPSARERHYEDVIVEHAAGATPAQLREDAEELHTLIDALTAEQQATDAAMLEAMRADDEAEARARAAEGRLLLRIDRRVEITDLEAMRDASRHRAAAARQQMVLADRLLTEKRRSRHGMVAVRGGATT